jgi:hypothetical protein
MGLIERGLMASRITKRSAVAHPRRFGAPFRWFAHRSARLPLRRLPSLVLSFFNSRRLKPGSLLGVPVGEASGRSTRSRSVHGDANVPHICTAFASPGTARILCVALLEQGASAFSVCVSRPPVGDDFMLVVSSTLGVGRLGVPPFAL